MINYMLECIFLTVACIMFVYYFFLVRNFHFWKSRGVKGPDPIAFFGTMKEVMRAKISFGFYLQNIYNDNKGEKMIGIFEASTPALVLCDLDLIKDVLIKDFSVFSDRALLYHEKIEPLSQHLFFVKTPTWRMLRAKLSPVFTVGKLKNMYNLMLEHCDELDNYLKNTVKIGEPIDCRDLTGRFVVDVIASCAFGLRTRTMYNEDSEFCRLAHKIFRNDFKTYLRMRVSQCPWLYNIIGRLFSDKDVEEFFIKITMESIEYRKKNNIRRDDIVDVLADLNDQKKVENIDITKPLLAAQLLLFYAAGFETSSITLTNAMYELALNHSIQDKLRREINEVLKSTDGKITFDCVKKMKYLDTFIREILRKYPPLTYLIRSSLTDYKFRGTDVTIPKETKVLIPVYAIHHDAEIYPKPDVFDPNRFTEEHANSRHPMTYLAFGDGPRNCIGLRFADCEVKIYIIKIVLNYIVDICEKTPPPPYPVNMQDFMVLVPNCKIYVKLSPISTH